MQHTILRHPKLTVREYTGSEGPAHDPYGYREIEITTPDKTVLYHEGLGTWLEVNGNKIEAPRNLTYDEGEVWLREQLPRLVGYRIEQLERIHRRLTERCSKCGGHDFHSESGYPGETFEVCDSCGNVQDTYFNESAVM